MERIPRIIAALSAAGLLAVGIWAFGAPRSFYTDLATYPPYNEHFVHDLGAFQIGAGLALFLALVWTDVLFVALTAVGAGSTLHFVAHLLDRDLGGSASDPVLTGIGAAALLAAALIRRSRAG